jgi:urease accessory protein
VSEPELLLTVLQHGDGAFPAGAFAFSWGLEGLVADGVVSGPDDVARLAADLLRHRWATFDRVALRRAFAAAPVPGDVAGIDREVETATLVAGQRAGSRRAGRALLGAHVRLATPGAAEYRALVDADGAPGHQPVVQGLVWRGVGLPLDAAETLGAWGLVAALASAGVRLGVLGHATAQAMLTRLRPPIAALLAAPPPEVPLHAFTPLADIAAARHPRRALRLFAT